ncbi:CRISPR system precrRNA processing endoribonuclease RAMP protein Cas6 [Psychrobacter jeotgali]|uniref:CRISPR system precrRNA processing endoribonuclease RAMP protein Cas6 n=1 Tax=Psychrobacter jeotgali TaxID=179010 RepID=UPI00191878E0|nr:CRISPR system precrRNA processing endoribonuclease RAMP protein Cas6 [Psychrobacter jeotgali]
MDIHSTAPASLHIANLTTLQLTVRQEDTLRLPAHSGSMLRGAFGVALRDLTCITALPECKDCPIKQFCTFPSIFETPALESSNVQAVNPYVIHIPSIPQDQCRVYKKGDIWHFSMTLMGAAIHAQNIIIKAWKQALQTGLGTHQPYKRATLLQVSSEDKPIYSHKDLPRIANGHLPDPKSPISVITLPKPNTSLPIPLTMRFLTPFRYQQDNRIISHPEQLDSTTFIASLYNRIRLCQDNHSPDKAWDIGYDSYHQFKQDIVALKIDSDIRPNHVARRSNRQQRKMQLYGLQGDIHLTGDYPTLTRLLPALQLGQYLHIGKSTTMGLGQYQLIFEKI